MATSGFYYTMSKNHNKTTTRTKQFIVIISFNNDHALLPFKSIQQCTSDAPVVEKSIWIYLNLNFCEFIETDLLLYTI